MFDIDENNENPILTVNDQLLIACKKPAIPLITVTEADEQDDNSQSNGKAQIPAPLAPTPEKSDAALRALNITSFSFLDLFKLDNKKTREIASKLRKKHNLTPIELLRCLLLNEPKAVSHPIPIDNKLPRIDLTNEAPREWLPIHLAAFLNKADMVETLIRYAHIDVNLQQEGTGNTPLHLASGNGCKATITLLLRLGADPNIQNQNGCIAIQEAGAKNSSGIGICTLLDNSQSITVDDSGLYGFTALHSAARFCQSENIRILLERGADPFATSFFIQTPKNITEDEKSKPGKHKGGISSADYVRTIQILTDAETEETRTHKAQMRRYQNWVKRDDFGALCGTFIEAVRAGNINILTAVFNIYPNVLTMDFHSITALHAVFKIQSNNILIQVLSTLLEWLKSKNYLPDIINKGDLSRLTPLHYAAIYNCSEAADLLLLNGAAPFLLNENGFSSLHEAAAKGSNDVIQVFIKHKIGFNQLTACSWSVLHSATRFGHATTAKLLIDNGANLGVPGYFGATVLDSALSECIKRADGENYYEVVKLLLSKNCPYHTVRLHLLPESIRDLLTAAKQIIPQNPVIDTNRPDQAPPPIEIPPLRNKLLQVDLSSENLESCGKKLDGSNPGALYHKKDDNSRWLGKMGFDALQAGDQLALERNMQSRTRAIEGVKLDAIKEKIGMDLYSILADKKYEVPETYLAVLPVRDLNITAVTNYASKILCTFGQATDTRAKTTTFAMSHWYENFISLKDNCGFLAALQDGKIPDSISIIYNRKTYNISTTPIIRLLAHARILGDVDVLGFNLGNIGLIPTETGFSLVKIDGTHIFQGYESNDYIHSARYHSADKKKNSDIQCNSWSAGQVRIIQWKQLTSPQKQIYIEELAKGLALCEDPSFQQFMLLREGRYQKYGCTDNITNISPYTEWTKDWLKRQQTEDYFEELQQYQLINQPAIDVWVNAKKHDLGLNLLPVNREIVAIPAKPIVAAPPPSTPPDIGTSTRAAEIILNVFKIYWKTNKKWPSTDILFQIVLAQLGGNQTTATNAISLVINSYSETLIRKLIDVMKISAEQLRQYVPDGSFSNILRQFSNVLNLSPTVFEELPLASLLKNLEDTILRHGKAHIPQLVETYIQHPPVIPTIFTCSALFQPPSRCLPPLRRGDKTVIIELEALLHEALEENKLYQDEHLNRFCVTLAKQLDDYRNHPLTVIEKKNLFILKQDLTNKLHIAKIAHFLDETYPEAPDEDLIYKSYRKTTIDKLNGYRNHLLSSEEISDLLQTEKDLEPLVTPIIPSSTV